MKWHRYDRGCFHIRSLYDIWTNPPRRVHRWIWNILWIFVAAHQHDFFLVPTNSRGWRRTLNWSLHNYFLFEKLVWKMSNWIFQFSPEWKFRWFLVMNKLGELTKHHNKTKFFVQYFNLVHNAIAVRTCHTLHDKKYPMNNFWNIVYVSLTTKFIMTSNKVFGFLRKY